MKLDELKIEGTSQSTVRHVSEFHVNPSEEEQNKVRVAGMTIKIGLCVAALLVAFLIRAVTKEPNQAVEVGKNLDAHAAATEEPGILRFAEANADKWSAPVATNDIEILRDGQLVRFTATEDVVRSCIDGTVWALEIDDRFGNYARVRSEDGTEIILYGMEQYQIQKGDVVHANDVIGTVPIGRSVYLSVLKDGIPMDPAEYVDLTIRGKDAAV